jgi:small subunit ribosomal protein S4
MARYTGPVCRLCRRASEKLFLKGERCYTPKCSVEKRRRPPGNQVARRRRVSDWGIQLREKQKARQIYGVLERQFRTYFGQARRSPGVTGTNLLELLERRLDNVVHRVGFGDSRQQARQRVLHGHFTVNGRKVWTPSYRVRSGDVVAWKERTTKLDFYQDVAKRVGQRPLPAWLSLNRSTMTAEVVRTPELEDFGTTIETRLIVEHYSR